MPFANQLHTSVILYTRFFFLHLHKFPFCSVVFYAKMDGICEEGCIQIAVGLGIEELMRLT